MTGPVYAKPDNTSYFQDKIVSTDEIENNIEDSVISDGDRYMEEMKDVIHKKNTKKGYGYVEVEVNSNGEDNLKDTTTTSYGTHL